MRYKKQIGADRRKVLDELVKQSETMGWVTEIGFHSSGLQAVRVEMSAAKQHDRTAGAIGIGITGYGFEFLS